MALTAEQMRSLYPAWAERFAAEPDHVGCLQGILDFYNPRANWLSRCFAIEYASWFPIWTRPSSNRVTFESSTSNTRMQRRWRRF